MSFSEFKKTECTLMITVVCLFTASERASVYICSRGGISRLEPARTTSANLRPIKDASPSRYRTSSFSSFKTSDRTQNDIQLQPLPCGYVVVLFFKDVTRISVVFIAVGKASVKAFVC